MINKNISGINTGSFFVMYFFLLILSAWLFFYYGTPICDKSLNQIDCNYYQLILTFIVPLLIDILLYLFIQSSRYREFENGRFVDKVTAIIEIIFAPIMSGVYFFIGYNITSIQYPDFNIFGTSTLYISILIFLLLIVDGIRRLRKNN
jgi:hypothetical protein